MTITVTSRSSTESVRRDYPMEGKRLDRIVPFAMPDRMFMKNHDMGCVLIAEIDPDTRTGTLTIRREFNLFGKNSITEPIQGGAEIDLSDMPLAIIRKAEAEFEKIAELEDSPCP